MIYQIMFDRLPVIDRIYSVTRHTVWHAIDPSHILIFITHGSCFVKIEGKTTFLEKGSYIIIPKNTPYVRYPVDDTSCTMHYVHFDATLQSVPFSEAQSSVIKSSQNHIEYFFESDTFTPNQNSIYISNNASLANNALELDDMLKKATSDFRSCTILSPLLVASEILRFLVLLSAHTITHILNEKELSKTKSDFPIKLQTAIIYIKQHDSDKITLEDLCLHCDVSKQYMIRCFKTYLQTTPTAYITQYKVSKACYLLQNSTANIQEISIKLGFENQCYFSRVFTKKMGETPTGFRTRVLTSQEKISRNRELI